MNVSIVYKSTISEECLAELSRELPVIIASVLEVPGGNVARLKPQEISLIFSPGSPWDTGSDIRVMAFARSNYARKTTERDRAQQILERVVELLATRGERFSVSIRLYLMEVGAAEHATGA